MQLAQAAVCSLSACIRWSPFRTPDHYFDSPIRVIRDLLTAFSHQVKGAGICRFATHRTASYHPDARDMPPGTSEGYVRS